MIWIVSCSIAGTEENLSARHQFIELVSQARVSPWQKRIAVVEGKHCLDYYQCQSEKGEYGFLITAHIDETFAILKATKSSKKTIYAINSCQVSNMYKFGLLNIIKGNNRQSELYLAQQEKGQRNWLFNYADDLGTFGFRTTKSERELFMRRENGLTESIRLAFEKVTAT